MKNSHFFWRKRRRIGWRERREIEGGGK
jgi:hypothetical protein